MQSVRRLPYPSVHCSMPPKTIVCTECGAGRANRTWQQSGNQFAALLLVEDEPPTPPVRTGAVTADVLMAEYETDRGEKPYAVKSSVVHR